MPPIKKQRCYYKPKNVPKGKGIHIFLRNNNFCSLHKNFNKNKKKNNIDNNLYRSVNINIYFKHSSKYIGFKKFCYGRGNAIIVDQQLNSIISNSSENITWQNNIFNLFNIHQKKKIILPFKNYSKISKTRKLWVKKYSYGHMLSSDFKNLQKEFKKISPLSILRIHPMAGAAWIFFLKKKKFIPVTTQLPVYGIVPGLKKSNKEQYISTSIDQVWFCPQKNILWLVEFKKDQNIDTSQIYINKTKKPFKTFSFLDNTTKKKSITSNYFFECIDSINKKTTTSTKGCNTAHSVAQAMTCNYLFWKTYEINQMMQKNQIQVRSAICVSSTKGIFFARVI